MANEENLITVSGRVARENGAKGGRQKAENAKERKKEEVKLKSAKEALVAAMEVMTLKLTDEAVAQKQEDMKALLEAAENPLVAQLVNIIFNKKTAPLTKLKALDMAFDRLEGKPKQSTELKAEITKEIIYVDAEEKEGYDKHIDEVLNNGKD